MRIKIDGIHLNYELAGSGDYLTLIHGMGADHTTWPDQVRGFSDRYKVLTVDVRGFGQSDKPPGPYSVKMFSDDLYGLFRALGVERIILAGHSMGGMIAMTFALDHPEMLTALILVDTSPAMAPEMVSVMEDSARMAETQGLELVVDASMERSFAPDFAKRQPEVFAYQRELRLRNDPIAYAAAYRAIVQFNLTAELGHIGCPTLIIVGDQDMPTPLDAARVLNDGIPASRLRVIKGSGHNTMLEQPEEFNAAVKLFLDAIGA